MVLPFVSVRFVVRNRFVPLVRRVPHALPVRLALRVPRARRPIARLAVQVR